MRPQLAPTRPSPLAWALVGLALGATLGVLRYAPARWLAQAVESLTEQRVRLADASGTVWDGSAQWQLTGGAHSQDAAALPSRLHWELRPAWGHLRVRLLAPCCTPQALELQLMPGLGRFSLKVQNGQSHWPAGLLQGLGTPWNTIQAQGALNLQTTGFGLDSAQGRWQVQGQARLDVVDLSSALSPLRPLGSYRLSVQGGPSTELSLQTLPRSPLVLEGAGRWVEGRLHFDGQASASADAQEALSNLLNIVGRRDGARSIIHLG